MRTLREIANRCLRIILDLIASCIGSVILPKRGLNYLPPINNRILLLPAVELVKQIKKGQLKSKDVVEAYIQRIRDVDTHVHAVVDERFTQAIEEAQAVDIKIRAIHNGQPDADRSLLDLPLLGVPFTGKDSIAIKDMVQTAGLYYRREVKADTDAIVVANLRKAGAIPIALTNVPELCMWFDSENTIYGRTNNPYDLSRIPGGSTGGNAACLAYAGSVLGVGSDIGGSIRMPAFFCGVYGHKTTPGIIPIDGHYPPVTQERQEFLSFGPMTRYAKDLIPMLKAMAGDNISKLPKLDQEVDLRSLKVFYMLKSGETITSPVEKEVASSIHRIVDHFDLRVQCRTKKISLTQLNHSFNIYLYGLLEHPAPTLAVEMADKSGQSQINLYIEFIKAIFGYSVHTLPMITAGLVERFTSNDPLSPKRIKCLTMMKSLKNDLDTILGEDGILIYPSHPTVAPKHKTTLFKMENVSYTAIFNLLNVAITQVPLGLTKEGIPVGCQVIAKAYNDHLTLAVAREVERVFDGWVAPSRIALTATTTTNTNTTTAN